MNDNPEPLFDIAHLGRVELRTPALKDSIWYFHDLLGMEVVYADDAMAYLRGYGDYATSTLKLSTNSQKSAAPYSAK